MSRRVALSGRVLTCRTQTHLPTPAQVTQSTEVSLPTPTRIVDAVDLTTPPPPPRQEIKREPKQEIEDSPEPVEASVEVPGEAPAVVPVEVPAEVEVRVEQEATAPPASDDVSLQPRGTHKRKRAATEERVSAVSSQVNNRSQETSEPSRRASKRKKKQGDSAFYKFTPVVEDAEYHNILKAPGGKYHNGLVAVSCKFCGANCSTHSGVKVLFRGDASWRAHVHSCHRGVLPDGTKLSPVYVMDNCMVLTPLTAQEEDAVMNHQHDVFAVVKIPGPGAEPGSTTRRRRKKRGTNATKDADEEGDDAAESQILDAVEDPAHEEINPDVVRLTRLEQRRQDFAREVAAANKGATADDGADQDEHFSAEEEEGEHKEEGEEQANVPSEPRTFGMSTRKGGRRTRSG